MRSDAPTLHLLCGKAAAGKSTLARQLAAAPRTILLSEDDWLTRLYPGEIRTIPDYAHCAGRLRAAIGGHIEDLLRAGLSVVLDFPANTPATRTWMRQRFEAAGTAHCLHLLAVSDAACKARLARRNAAGTHPYQVSDAEFDAITRYFVPPSPEEGFNIRRADTGQLHFE